MDVLSRGGWDVLLLCVTGFGKGSGRARVG